jgi:hypothetical protein
LDYQEATAFGGVPQNAVTTAVNPWQEILSKFLAFWEKVSDVFQNSFGSAAFEKK